MVPYKQAKFRLTDDAKSVPVNEVSGELWMVMIDKNDHFISSYGRVMKANVVGSACSGQMSLTALGRLGFSNFTLVHSLANPVPLTPDGYFQWTWWNPVQQKHITERIHQIVARHFLADKWFKGAQVDHSSGDKTDNSITNLRWVTQSVNQQNRWSNSRVSILF